MVFKAVKTLVMWTPALGRVGEKMAFDFKKEYKDFYLSKSKPKIITVPKVNYIAVRGKGKSNEKGYANDMNQSRLHHEIYLSDPRKAEPEKMENGYSAPNKEIIRKIMSILIF